MIISRSNELECRRNEFAPPAASKIFSVVKETGEQL